MELTVSIHTKISDIPKVSWNALVQDNHPFLKHEFLHAMEKHGCVGKHFGWIPCHIAIYKEKKLIGAMPLYEKYNSYGEFVFDHAWAQAWKQQGKAYFPKLVSAIPYTPANGQRLLYNNQHKKQVLPILLNTVYQMLDAKNASGFHILFPTQNEQAWLVEKKPLVRHDCQFHWFNKDYQQFDDFLQTLTSKKRKNIRQERRKLYQYKVSFRILNGHTAKEKDWDIFTTFYKKTFDEKWSTATFNAAFFKEIAQTLPKQIILILADYQDQCIAGALLYQSDHTLYGRHWGCSESFDGLHFETCYYQGIHYAIEQGLQTFEPGAQGEHKIARGFIPIRTQSSHFMMPNPFQSSLKHFVQHEKEAVDHYIERCNQHTPYKEPQ